MQFIHPAIYVMAVAVVSLMTGCASTKVETSGLPVTQPLCRAGAPAVAAAIFWRPQWRPDQKDPALREAAALRGIEDFVKRTDCLAPAGMHRLQDSVALPSTEEFLRLAAALPVRPQRILIIVIHELGPRLEIGIPVIVEGGTEVLLDLRVLDAQNAHLLADTRLLWRNGGRFVIKGVKTLNQDMSTALSAALMPSAAGK